MIDWQILTTVAVVILAVLFLVRKATAGNKGGCGRGCGCDHAKRPQAPQDPDSGA